MNKFTVEDIVRIYNDTTGEYIQISEDPDGLDMVELSWGDGEKRVDRLPPILFEHFEAFVNGCRRYIDHVKNKT